MYVVTNFQILEELEAQHGNEDETTQELLRLLHAQSFPATVNEPIFISHSGKLFKQIRRPLDNRFEENHIHLLNSLGIESVVAVFTALLFEKKVIILGSSLAKISAVVESLTSILTPFEWQHTLVGQDIAWQSATLLPISCKSVQPVPARVEELVSPVRQFLVVVARTIHPFPRCSKPAREIRLSKPTEYCQCV